MARHSAWLVSLSCGGMSLAERRGSWWIGRGPGGGAGPGRLVVVRLIVDGQRALLINPTGWLEDGSRLPDLTRLESCVVWLAVNLDAKATPVSLAWRTWPRAWRLCVYPWSCVFCPDTIYDWQREESLARGPISSFLRGGCHVRARRPSVRLTPGNVNRV